MARPLTVGIIGCGVIAPAHIESYQLLPGVRVRWACDLIRRKADAVAQRYAIPNVCTDFHAVVRDPAVDAISVCTDHASHAPITAAALRAGKHVLCEKALAANAVGLRQMFRAHAARPDLVFSGVFQHRFDPAMQYLKRLVEQGAFGTILTADMHMRCLRTADYYKADTWRGTWAKEGGAVLINQAIHFIDLLVWIMGGVAALTGAHANLTHNGVIETEDTAVAALRFRNGALGVIDATCSSNIAWEHTLEIHGAAGAIEWRNGQALKVAFASAARTAQVTKTLAACIEEQRIRGAKAHYGAGHPAQIADFVRAIRAQRAPFVPAAAARHTVEVVLAIYAAQQQRRWITLPRG
jgi:predicted dehydrogenase